MGQGVKPQVTLSLGSGDNLRLDIGHVMAHDLVHKTFTLTNASSLKIRFKLNMESLSSKKESMKTFSEWKSCAGFESVIMGLFHRSSQSQWTASLHLSTTRRSIGS